MTSPSPIQIYTDGACSGNPGPGGWAAIVIPSEGAEPVELSGLAGGAILKRVLPLIGGLIILLVVLRRLRK